MQHPHILLTQSQSAQKVRHVPGVQPAGGDLVKQWLEGVVHPPVNQRDAYWGALKRLHDGESGESAANDDNVGERVGSGHEIPFVALILYFYRAMVLCPGEERPHGAGEPGDVVGVAQFAC